MADDVTTNSLLVKVLEMLAILVKYGYYDCTKDVDEILERLVSILNGFTDLPSSTSPSAPTLGMCRKKNKQVDFANAMTV